MVLAELLVRHTRRHVPVRRVAVGDALLPTGGPGHGSVLLAAVVSECLPELEAEQADLVPRLVADAREGLDVPRLALRYRLQHDTHGLDGSRHRIVQEGDVRVLELDRHGRPEPQVIGAVMAAAALPGPARAAALRAITRAVARPMLPTGLVVRRLLLGMPGAAPPPAGVGGGAGPAVAWGTIDGERRWAMEVFGLGPGAALERADVQSRYRRLLRQAHPDHGGAHHGAAERLAELTEARTLLLGVIASTGGEAAG